MLRIENSNYNKGGSEFFVATGGSMIGCQGLPGWMVGWLVVAASCMDGMEAGRQADKPNHNVHGASNNGTHFTHARLKVAPHHRIMDHEEEGGPEWS